MESITIASNFSSDYLAAENLIYSVYKYTNFKKINIISNNDIYKEKMKTLCDSLGFESVFYFMEDSKITNLFKDEDRHDELKHIPTFVYSKMLIPSIVNYERTLYLDTDTLFINNFDKTEVPQDENPIYAVNNGKHDPSYWHKHYSSFMKDEEETAELAFNAGVIFYNIKQSDYWKYIKKIKESVKNNRFSYLDQAHLNYVYKGEVKFLETKYNYPVHNDYKEVVNSTKEPIILHFASKVKPWNSEEIPNWNKDSIKWYDIWIENNNELQKHKDEKGI